MHSGSLIVFLVIEYGTPSHTSIIAQAHWNSAGVILSDQILENGICGYSERRYL